MGYHLREIPRGVFGEFSKIVEEFQECLDAHEQNNPVMTLVELADLLGAIRAFTRNTYNVTLDDLIVMADATGRAFSDGTRTPRDDAHTSRIIKYSDTRTSSGEVELTKAERDILNERRRQIEDENWTPEHDDTQDHGELAIASCWYAANSVAYKTIPQNMPFEWPWDISWWKPKNRRYDLVRAAALIVAEIERLDRADSNAEADRVRAS